MLILGILIALSGLYLLLQKNRMLRGSATGLIIGGLFVIIWSFFAK